MRGTPEDFSGDFEIFDLYELELHNVLLLNALPTSYYNFFFRNIGSVCTSIFSKQIRKRTFHETDV
jgi:hypothetical protein